MISLMLIDLTFENGKSWKAFLISLLRIEKVLAEFIIKNIKKVIDNIMNVF